MSENLLTVGEAAKLLGRSPHTVRVWEYQGRLPAHLIPRRDERGWRWFTPEQVDGIRQWLIDEDIRPGKGLRK